MSEFGEMKVIGNWQPSVLGIDVIIKEFRSKLKGLGFRDFSLTRLNVRQAGPDRSAKIWHQDMYGDPDYRMLVWSNKNPTLIRSRETQKAFEAKDGDMIWIDNGAVEHRYPAEADNEGRWFLRLFFYPKFVNADAGRFVLAGVPEKVREERAA